MKEKLIVRNNMEIREYYQEYLDVARAQVSVGDIPEWGWSFEFLESLYFQSQHLYGKYDTEAWNHAGNEVIEEVFSDKKMSLIWTTIAISVIIFYVVVIGVVGLANFTYKMSPVGVCFIMIGLAISIKSRYYAVSRMRDDLMMAARYQAMAEILEKRLDME